MVHQKNADTVFDFDTEGINTLIDGGGGGGNSGGDGDTMLTTPVGIIHSETPCDPRPEGDLNRDCMLEFYEVCLIDIDAGLVNQLSSENLSIIEAFVNENGCDENMQVFINNAIEVLINGDEVNWEELIISLLLFQIVLKILLTN